MEESILWKQGNDKTAVRTGQLALSEARGQFPKGILESGIGFIEFLFTVQCILFTGLALFKIHHQTIQIKHKQHIEFQEKMQELGDKYD